MRIASYNVHKAVGRDGRRDPARILHVLNEMNADVVALQEADRRLGARPTALPRPLIARETDYQVADLARNDVSLGWHGNAVLVRRGLPIDATRHFELPGLEPRGAVFVKVGALSIVGTHLGLLRGWRRRQMTAILGHLAGETRSTLIVGDFNEWSDVRGCEPWGKHFEILYPGRSFPTARPIASLDGVAHGDGVRILDCGVMASRTARVASDHLPIWVDVEVA